MANSVIEEIATGTFEVSKTRYEELVRAELKAKQYRIELEKMGEETLVGIIEATEVEYEIESEENENGETK